MTEEQTNVEQVTVQEQPAEQPAEQPQLAPEDQAAQQFGIYLPMFRQITSKLSRRGLQRVINSILEFPLQDGKIKVKGQAEEQAFALGLSLMDCKGIMVNAVITEKLKKEQENGTMATNG